MSELKSAEGSAKLSELAVGPGAKGWFIVIEGIDGSGSTTQTQLLEKSLRQMGSPVLVTREPSAGPIGRMIRQILERRLPEPAEQSRSFRWSTMALLFAADRLDHLDSEVLPAVAEGKIVLSDRYDLSSLAYQSVTSEEPEQVLPWIRQLNNQARRPDLTIVLDVSPRVAEQRRASRGRAVELYEHTELQARLAEVYLRAEELVPGDRVVHIDGDQSILGAALEVLKVVTEFLAEPRPV